MSFDNNQVYLVSSKGKKRLKRNCIKGLTIDIKGINNTCEIHCPTNFVDSTILIRGRNNKVIIEKYKNIGIVKINIVLKRNQNNRLVHIKEGVSIRSGNIFCLGNNIKCLIGKDCLFSDNITIRTSDAHTIRDVETNEKINPDKDVIIGDRVWCGKNVTFSKGAVVPNDCVIGTGAFVNKQFEEGNCVLAGMPAKTVKRNIKWEL